MSGIQASPRKILNQRKRLSQASTLSEARSDRIDNHSNACTSPLPRSVLCSPGSPPTMGFPRASSFSSTSSRNTLSQDGTPSKIPKPPLRQPSASNHARINGGSSRIKPPNGVAASAKKPVTIETLLAKFPLGSWVETTSNKISGLLRFLGPIQSKEGLWAGIELGEKGTGKNDGMANGIRYFTCPANSGVFVPALSLLPSTRQTRPEPRQATKGLQPGLRPPKNKTANGARPVSLVVAPSADKLSPNPLLASSASSAAINKISRDLSRDHKPPIKTRPTLGQSPVSENTLAVKGRSPSSALQLPRNDLEDLEGDLSEYLNSPNANPTLVIQSLVSQLHSYRKQNELLQVRINKKRAHNEATRVLRTEFIDRARQEILSRRLTKTTSSDKPKMDDLNSRIATCDADIKRLLTHTETLLSSVEPLPEIAHEGELVDELRQKLQDIFLIHTELQTLHRQLVTREDLLNQLKDELVYAQEQSGGPKLADILVELDALKRESSQEIDSLRDEIRRLKSSTLGTPTHEVEDLKQQLKDTEAKIQTIEKLGAEAEEKSRRECERLTEEIKRLSSEKENDQMAESLELIQKLKDENAELHEALEEYLNEEQHAAPEQLQEEKEKHLAALRAAQKEKENMVTQIQALKSALSLMEASQGPVHNEFPRTSEAESARAMELEQRVLQLEDELALSKNFSDKLREGNFTEKDLHDNLVSELDSRNQCVMRLEADLKDMDDRYQQLMEANDQLMADAQALEDDNWRIDDMYKELQEEMERVLAQFNDSKDKTRMLEQALDAASANSDSAKKVNELMVKCDENEALHKAELDGLYKVIDEQDEELTLLAERETELMDQVKELRAQLAQAKRGELLDDAFDELDADALKQLDDDMPFCHLCCDTGHEPAACPNPPAEDDADLGDADLDLALKDLDLDLALLDDELICSDCQQPGHSFEDCPNSTQVF